MSALPALELSSNSLIWEKTIYLILSDYNQLPLTVAGPCTTALISGPTDREPIEDGNVLVCPSLQSTDTTSSRPFLEYIPSRCSILSVEISNNWGSTPGRSTSSLLSLVIEMLSGSGALIENKVRGPLLRTMWAKIPNSFENWAEILLQAGVFVAPVNCMFGTMKDPSTRFRLDTPVVPKTSTANEKSDHELWFPLPENYRGADSPASTHWSTGEASLGTLDYTKSSTYQLPQHI